MSTPEDGGQMYDERALLSKNRLHMDEAAFLLRIGRSTLDRYMREGKIEFVRLPGRHRKPLTDSVKKYIR